MESEEKFKVIEEALATAGEMIELINFNRHLFGVRGETEEKQEELDLASSYLAELKGKIYKEEYLDYYNNNEIKKAIKEAERLKNREVK